MRRVLLGLLALAALAGCGGSRSGSSAGPPTQTGPGPATTTTGGTTTSGRGGAGQTVRIYLLRDGVVVPVARTVAPTQAVARTALTELIAGPTSEERTAGLTSDVPTDTQLRGLTISSGEATVDFDAAFAAGAEATIAPRLAQVVYTLTQFPSVSSVRFEADGKPLPGLVDGNAVPATGAVARSDYEALTPSILIESPLPGETVTSPIAISGTAVAFEATFQTEVVDASGAVVGTQTVTASAGGPERGTYSASITVDAPPGPVRLVAYEDNAGNGKRIHVVSVPLRLGG